MIRREQVDHVGRGLLVGSQTTSRFLSTQYGIYGVILVVLVVLAVSCARDEHLLWEGRVWRGHVAHARALREGA